MRCREIRAGMDRTMKDKRGQKNILQESKKGGKFFLINGQCAELRETSKNSKNAK